MNCCRHRNKNKNIYFYFIVLLNNSNYNILFKIIVNIELVFTKFCNE